MKKTLLVLAIILVSGLFFSSCSSSHSCPAYSKVHQLPDGSAS